MKKYNLYDLYVFKIYNNSEVNCYICNKKGKEIFTDVKINLNIKNTSVEPLFHYYEPLTRSEYIILSKLALLKKYIEINTFETTNSYKDLVDEESREIDGAIFTLDKIHSQKRKELN